MSLRKVKTISDYAISFNSKITPRQIQSLSFNYLSIFTFSRLHEIKGLKVTLRPHYRGGHSFLGGLT